MYELATLRLAFKAGPAILRPQCWLQLRASGLPVLPGTACPVSAVRIAADEFFVPAMA